MKVDAVQPHIGERGIDRGRKHPVGDIEVGGRAAPGFDPGKDSQWPCNAQRFSNPVFFGPGLNEHADRTGAMDAAR